MDGAVMDIVVRNDRQAALDVLHNIWSYKGVEVYFEKMIYEGYVKNI